MPLSVNSAFVDSENVYLSENQLFQNFKNFEYFRKSLTYVKVV